MGIERIPSNLPLTTVTPIIVPRRYIPLGRLRKPKQLPGRLHRNAEP